MHDTAARLGPDPATVARDGAALVLTREAMRWAVPAAAVLVVGALVLRGVAGGVTAAATAASLLAIQYVSGWAVGRASRYGAQALQAATLLGVLVRLVLYGVLVFALAGVTALDVPSMAVTVCTLVVVLLAAETRMAARYGALWWTPAPSDPTTDRTSAPAGAEQKDRT